MTRTFNTLSKNEYVGVTCIAIFIQLCIFLLPLATTSPLLQAWVQWDGDWYTAIAQHGYQTTAEMRHGIAFLPLYPLLIRVAHTFTSNYQVAALLVSNIASTLALILLYRFVRLEKGVIPARWTLVTLLLFPTAYFFVAPYTDGLNLLLVLTSVYSARRGWWPLAGVTAGLAAFTRITSVILLPTLLVEYFLQKKAGPNKSWTSATWLLFIPFFFGLYLFVSYYLYGTPFAYSVSLEEYWHKSLSWPGVSLITLFVKAMHIKFTSAYFIQVISELLAGLFLLGGTIWAWKVRMRPTYITYMSLLTLLILSTSFLQSTPRYLLSAFPLFMLLGSSERYRGYAPIILTFSLCALIYLTQQFTQGFWAF